MKVSFLRRNASRAGEVAEEERLSSYRFETENVYNRFVCFAGPKTMYQKILTWKTKSLKVSFLRRNASRAGEVAEEERRMRKDAEEELARLRASSRPASRPDARRFADEEARRLEGEEARRLEDEEARLFAEEVR